MINFMKHADLHMHTCYSHGRNTPWEMHAAACKKGLGTIGFTEHSPRPSGYDYSREYREQLERHFPDYIRDVQALKACSGQSGCRVLLGLEMDWLGGERNFIAQACKAYGYDYLIGSVHFIGRWGFDDLEEKWLGASSTQCFSWYEMYFHSWLEMIESRLFQIAAHPDLIKIFSVERFHQWLERNENLNLIEKCLLALRAGEMALEISSAGLRKACKEIYPAPEIMNLASRVGVNITLASDAHNAGDVGADFDRLAGYARSFGFKEQTIYNGSSMEYIPL